MWSSLFLEQNSAIVGYTETVISLGLGSCEYGWGTVVFFVENLLEMLIYPS